MNIGEFQESIEVRENFVELTPEGWPNITKEVGTGSKTLSLVFLWMYTIVEAASTTMVNPLIPAEALRHGIDQFMVGLLFFVMSLSCLMTSLLLGQVQSTLGRRNIILVAFILKICSYIGFLALRTVNSSTLALLLLVILHISQGVSMGAYKTAVYSILSILYPDRIDFVVSWIESSSGIGFSVGPALGSLLFSYGGYELPFYFFLGVIISMTIMTTKFIPSYINYGKTERTADNRVSYLTLLKNKRVIFACIVVALNAITYDFLNPILASVMYTYYGITEARVGWLFFLMGTGYVISWNLANVTLKYFTNRRVVVTFLAINAFSILFLGPSNILNTEANILVTWISLFLWGISSAHFFVPVYSEIVGPGKHELGIDEDIITDLASGLSNTTYFLGQMIGYTTCSYVYTNAGFPATIDMLGTLLLTVAIAYFFMCDKSMLGSEDYETDKELSQKVIFNEDMKAPLIDTIL